MAWIRVLKVLGGLAMQNRWKKLHLLIEIVPLGKVREYYLFFKPVTKEIWRVYCPSDPWIAELITFIEEEWKIRVLPEVKMD